MRTETTPERSEAVAGRRERSWEVVVVSGPDCGRVFALEPGRHTLGRSPACGIDIDDPDLEPHHVMLVWEPPLLSVLPLAGTGEVDGSSLRVGRSHCELRESAGFEDRIGQSEPDNDRPAVLHRPARVPGTEVVRPVRPACPDEPARATSPAWSTVVTGIVSGLAVAALSGQWYFASFSLVTGVVTAASWSVRVVRARRRLDTWRDVRAEMDAQFVRECHRYAVEAADMRRRSHPSIIDIRDEIRSGGPWLWHERDLGRVSVGRGSRAIDVAEGVPVIRVDDVPVLVNVGPHEVVGVHGRRAWNATAALVVRMAAQVGPSDLCLSVIGDLGADWAPLTRLPHHVPAGDIVDRPGPRRPRPVLIVTDASSIVRSSPVMRARDESSATIIVVAGSLAHLPSACTAFVDADDEETDGIGVDLLHDMCSDIAKWRDPDVEGSGIPTTVSFPDLVGDRSTTCPEVLGTWSRRRGLGPRVSLGLDVDGVVELDIDADGPHGVIIGTTGSGKSELLRQIVVSMALSGSPEDVSFVLIDYKGGSAFDACADLPHVCGVITDLDGGMAERVLLGLEAELRRRESVLRAARVADVLEFHTERFRHGSDERLPRLVLVIDELAALRNDAPAFLPGLAAIAQRGRSLGLHLIVASQRSAALTADVMANASIRIALRVHSGADSVDVVGTDRAATIDRSLRGRLVLRVGSDVDRDVQAAHISPVLGSIVSTLTEACAGADVGRPLRPWSDPLPAVIMRPEDAVPGRIGINDDVLRHCHKPVSFACDHHLLIVGGRGRTNALRAVLRSLGDRAVDVIVVSCRASSSPDLDGCGASAELANHERIERILRLCESRMRSRHNRGEEARRIVLAVDDVDLWRARTAHDRVESQLWETFERIVTSTSTAAVTCLMTSARDQAVPSSVAARVSSVWTGTERSGVFQVCDRSNEAPIETQIFWELPTPGESAVIDPRLERSLRCLPEMITDRGSGFAVHADTWDMLEVDPNELLRFVVLGPRGSGVTTALSAITRSWTQAHPHGIVVDLARASVPGANAEIADAGSDAMGESRPVLVVADDVHRHAAWNPWLTRALDDAQRGAQMSLLVGAPPSFVRSRPDHWIHLVRRSRTGVLLGRSIVEDCDLLGLHSSPLHVYAPASGRGLWVDGGAARGIVQFVVDGSG